MRTMMRALVVVNVMALLGMGLAMSAHAQQCGWQAGDALCPNNLCCSLWGWCGSEPYHCGAGCQSQCTTAAAAEAEGDSVASIISQSLFDEMLPNRNDLQCPARGFYTYDAFIAAANAWSGFGTTGDAEARKREVAAFLAQTSHETKIEGLMPFGGPYSWGYCLKEESGGATGGDDYCRASWQWPCVPGNKYYGRGPMKLRWNDHYGAAGEAIGVGADLLNHPDRVANDSLVAFKTALWFWMTPRPPMPSCHDVITGRWSPSADDEAAGRLPGYGVLTNIINGGHECGYGADVRDPSRIIFYMSYCSMLGVNYGDNLDCFHQAPFGVDDGTATAATATSSSEHAIHAIHAYA